MRRYSVGNTVKVFVSRLRATGTWLKGSEGGGVRCVGVRP